MSLAKLKQQALHNTEVAQEYQRLETEFLRIDQLIAMRKKATLTLWSALLGTLLDLPLRQFKPVPPDRAFYLFHP